MARTSSSSSPAAPRYIVRNAALTRYGHRTLDEGQVFELDDMINDEKLIRLSYITEDTHPDRQTYQCAQCGAEFAWEPYRAAHVKRRHLDPLPQWQPGQTISEREHEAIARREAEEAERIARSLKEHPLALDKTKAALDG